MKITRAQKDAVISLLREKFNEKQEIVNEQFLSTNKKEIDKEISEYKELVNRLTRITTSLNDVLVDFEELKKSSKYILFNKMSFGVEHHYDWKTDTRDFLVNSSIKSLSEDKIVDVLNCPEIERPDFNKVERQLELDTLSKDFDLDKFLEKYLDN